MNGGAKYIYIYILYIYIICIWLICYNTEQTEQERQQDFCVARLLAIDKPQENSNFVWTVDFLNASVDL